MKQSARKQQLDAVTSLGCCKRLHRHFSFSSSVCTRTAAFGSEINTLLHTFFVILQLLFEPSPTNVDASRSPSSAHARRAVSTPATCAAAARASSSRSIDIATPQNEMIEHAVAVLFIEAQNRTATTGLRTERQAHELRGHRWAIVRCLFPSSRLGRDLAAVDDGDGLTGRAGARTLLLDLAHHVHALGHATEH